MEKQGSLDKGVMGEEKLIKGQKGSLIGNSRMKR